MEVFDASGRFVVNLIDGTGEAGLHTVTWNGMDRYGKAVASGVYFYTLSTEKKSISRKMVIMR